MDSNHENQYKRPNYWVYEGDVCRAAQHCFYDALKYLQPRRRIVTMPRDKNGFPYNPGY